jgi:hypothetical protein
MAFQKGLNTEQLCSLKLSGEKILVAYYEADVMPPLLAKDSLIQSILAYSMFIGQSACLFSECGSGCTSFISLKEIGVRSCFLNSRVYNQIMVRPLRIEPQGAVYHVMTRGNAQGPISRP